VSVKPGPVASLSTLYTLMHNDNSPAQHNSLDDSTDSRRLSPNLARRKKFVAYESCFYMFKPQRNVVGLR